MTETLFRLEDFWGSARIIEFRRKAADDLLKSRGQRNYDGIDGVLDFFETIALLRNRKVLNKELVWYYWYWRISCYWLLAQDYVAIAQHEEGRTVWEDLRWLVKKLQKYEYLRSKVKGAQRAPSVEQAREFLKNESRLFTNQGFHTTPPI